LGNGAIVNYTIEGAVGEIPSAVVDYEGSNIGFNTGSTKLPNPAINTETLCARSGEVALPTANTGSMETPILRPENISLDFGPTLLSEGGPILPGNSAPGLQSVHITDFTIEVPFDTEAEGALGQGVQNQMVAPVNITFQCSALLTDVAEGNLIKNICNPIPRDITVNLKPPCLACSGDNPNPPNMSFSVRGAVFESQNIISTLEEPAKVTLNFTTQLGGPLSPDKGLVISGTYRG
jgi:hypothetical protein